MKSRVIVLFPRSSSCQVDTHVPVATEHASRQVRQALGTIVLFLNQYNLRASTLWSVVVYDQAKTLSSVKTH
jgi:hypothetical protein